MIKDALKKHKAEMNRVRLEMQTCGTPHRNDLYKYYQRLKKEYDEAIYWIRKTEKEQKNDREEGK